MSKIKPNIVRGGQSIDLGNNMFLMQGRPHSRGGIDIGKDLEVEGGEVMEYKKDEVRVFSKEPILNGESPAQRVLGGANPDDVFNAQEYWKIANRINDDGTKRQYGGDDKTKNQTTSQRDSSQVNKFKPGDNSNIQSNRIAHRKSLEKFVKNNPQLYGLKTADFVDFLLDNATMESGNDAKAQHGSMYGYYQLKGLNTNSTEEQQHKAAFKHLKKIFSNILTDADVTKANELEISQAQLLHKVWNQERKVLNYLYQGKDNTDGLGTKISKWGNNNSLEINYVPYLMKATYDNNINIKKGDTPEKILKSYRGAGLENRTFNNHVKDYQNLFGANPNKLKIGDVLTNSYLIGPRKPDGTFKYGGKINKPVNMDFNYIIGKNNIYKLGGRKKAPLGIDILNSQNLHRNAEVFDGVPAIVVDEQVIRPDVNTEQQRLLNEASQIINNSIQASVNRDASTLNRINQIEGINGPVTIDGRSGTIRPDGTIDLQNRYTLAGNNRGVGYKSISERNKLLRQAKVRNAVNNIKQGIKDNSSELLSTGINLAGNLVGSLINLNAINKMKYYDIIPLRANKMKTNININPQLDTLREQLARFEGDTRNNTSSSKVALARRQSARARTAQAINQLFGTKENLQTELINRDRMNQQQVGNMNVQMRNRWRAGKSQFDNQIRNLRAENAIAGINNAIAAFNGENGYFNTKDKKFNEQANRALYALTAPNAIDAITSKNAEKLINTFVEPRFRKRMRRSLGID